MKRCPVCNGSMEGKRSHAVFCSRTCKTKASDQRRIADGRSIARDRERYGSTEGERRREYAREYHRKNPELVWEWRLQKRARRLGAEVFSVTARDWRRLIHRFGNRCAYCGGAGELQCDHVIPLTRGGVHSVGNILPACAACNMEKRTSFLTEWKAKA